MIKLWVGADDEFFQEMFAYLKRKFYVKLSALEPVQKFTTIAIYHETIVALESVHTVLRKIENGAAPTQEDYDLALEQQNEKRVQEIIDFYKRLALLNDVEFDAFNHFCVYYDFDPMLSRYVTFLTQYDSGQFKQDVWRAKRTWMLESFNAKAVFTFIERYQAELCQPTPANNPAIQAEFDRQNRLYEDLLRDYDTLIEQAKNIGVCVVDIILPTKFDHERYDQALLPKIIVELERLFYDDSAIFLTVNHVQVLHDNHFILSYLFIYNGNIYKNSTELSERIKSEVRWVVGMMRANQVQVHNREDMLKKLYPKEKEVFLGTLSSSKQKAAFRHKFLRYFLSNIFLMDLDKGAELERLLEIKKITLNNYVFYRDKRYRHDEQPVAASKEKTKKNRSESEQQPSIQYLDNLIYDIDVNKMDKYFGNKELPVESIDHLKLIAFLYQQQGMSKVSKSTIDDLIMMESFLMRLVYSYTSTLNDRYTRKNYEMTPRFEKLSLLLQQFVLVSKMHCVSNSDYIPNKIYTKAIRFIHQLHDDFAHPEQDDCIFFKRYYADELGTLKQHLEDYKTQHLKLTVYQEQQQSKKNSKVVKSIQKHLNKTLEKDIIAMRILFECDIDDEQEAQLFDDIFRDFVNNLKRRRTANLTLVGHVGVYIPHKTIHYIDATLLFTHHKDIAIDMKKSQRTVLKYWEDYIKNKSIQIENFNKKHPQHTGFTINPFDVVKKVQRISLGSKPVYSTQKWQPLNFCRNTINPFISFKHKFLHAKPIPVVKTVHSLDSDCIQIFQGQKKMQQLFVEKMALYYAHCPMILVNPHKAYFFSRKSFLILGRDR